MNLTPIDVEQKAFTQALRGYQMDEVDDFLDEVVGTLRAYEQRLREAHDKIRVLETETTPARGGDESEISRAILTAQRTADRLLAEARGEAESIKAEGEAENSRLVAQRDAERNRLHSEILSMSDLVTDLRNSLGALTAAIVSQVDEMDTEIEKVNSGLGLPDEVPNQNVSSDQNVSEEELLDDFDSMTPTEDVDVSDDETVEDDSAPTFSDIFPEPEVDLRKESEGKTRVTSRPWERG
jgi:cell division initiation protein